MYLNFDEQHEFNPTLNKALGEMRVHHRTSFTLNYLNLDKESFTIIEVQYLRLLTFASNEAILKQEVFLYSLQNSLQS